MNRTSLARRFFAVAIAGCSLLAGSIAGAARAPHHVEPAGEHEELIANPMASSGSCGVERWSVKVGTDPDAHLVNLGSTTSQTIVFLRGVTAPASPPLNARVQPTESTDYLVDATLVEYKLENDSDYHLVIKDASGNTMIAEIPDPACVATSSPFYNLIKAARAQFDAKYTATTSFQTANIPVRLTGVGFFDFQHGQTGVAPNAIELHPTMNVVFNPGQGTPDFGLAAAPSAVSVTQGGTTTSTITVVPQNGFNSSVSFAAAGLPSGVTASFSPASSASATTLTLTASASAATGPATISIAGSTGSLTHTISLALTVNPAGSGGGTTAIYNASLKAPWCSTVGSSCDSGTLLVGRGTITGGAEPNQPNAINGSCTDGASGTFHATQSNDRIVVASTNGSALTAGSVARITDTVWVYSTSTDKLDLYSAPNANSPTWTFLNTITPTATGAQTLTTTFTLPTGGLQAVRAHFRSGGSATACSTGAYDESDDLVFAVSSTAPAPDFSLSSSPSAMSANPGASATSTVTVGSLNGFSAATNLSVSGLPSGITGSIAPTPVTPLGGGSASATLTLNVSSAAAAGTYNVTVTGTSGTITHVLTDTITVTVAGTTPTANFSFATSGLAATFTDSSTDVGGTITGHSWTFGDGATSTATSPSHTYAAAGTYSVTETVTDSGGKTASKTSPVTVTSGGTTQLLGNPGFETGTASPWSMSTGILCSNSSCSGEVAHGGTWFAWLNGYGATHTDTVSQQVAIPAGKTSAMLQFYMHVDTAETTTTTQNDKLTVGVYSTSGTLLKTLNTYSNLDANTGYSVHNLTMTAYIGQTVVVKFIGTENSSKQTSFVVDDVNLNVQ